MRTSCQWLVSGDGLFAHSRRSVLDQLSMYREAYCARRNMIEALGSLFQACFVSPASLGKRPKRPEVELSSLQQKKVTTLQCVASNKHNTALRSQKTRNRAAGGSVLRSAKLLEVKKLEIEPPEAAFCGPRGP